MITNLKVTDLSEIITEELRISAKQTHLRINLMQFVDKDTNQIVLFSPSMDVTAYGETEDKAREMMKITIDDLCVDLMNMSSKHREKALREMGWKPKPFKN